MSSTSSQELVVSASGSNEPECEPSRSARLIRSAGASSPSIGRASPATMTCEPSPPIASGQTAFPWMSSAEASPARTSARLDLARELKASGADFGPNTPDLLASFDPATSSWRTSLRCFLEDWVRFSGTWPRSGTMRSGIAYQLRPLVPYTDETAFGLWATPTICGNYNRKGASKTSGDGLATQARMWPTPNAGDYKAGMSNAPNRQQSSLPRSVGIAEGVSSGRRGGLNPTWVEWLMGFPMGWTVLKASATPSSRKSRKSSGGQS
jgi:hypothetical protein